MLYLNVRAKDLLFIVCRSILAKKN